MISRNYKGVQGEFQGVSRGFKGKFKGSSRVSSRVLKSDGKCYHMAAG
jgi:hypothetical protein